MNWALMVSKSEEQTTVSPGVIRIILYHFPLDNHPQDLYAADQTIQPQHLAQCVLEKKNLFLWCRSNLDQNILLSSHFRIVA